MVLAELLSHVQLFATPWNAAHQISLSFTISHSLLKLMSFESMMSSNHLILYHPLLLPSIFPSTRVFFSESALLIRWPKYWSFSISPSNEYSGLISFSMDWLDLLAVQGTLKSFLQHHSSKASILQHSVQFSSVTQSCLTLCDPINCSTPVLPVIPFSSCLQSFPESGSFLMNHFFSSGGQSIGVAASASVLPMNIQD